jgi:hypothetical protein
VDAIEDSYPRAARTRRGRIDVRLVLPEQLAGFDADGKGVVVAGHHVHDAVSYQRLALVAGARLHAGAVE